MKANERFYDIDGVGRLPSVTTILQVISKPALYAWQAKQGSLKALNVMERVKEMAPYIHDAIKTEFGPGFFRNGDAIAAEAADYGTQAHGIIERSLKGQTISDEELCRLPMPVQKAAAAFFVWKSNTKFQLIKAESLVFSKKFRYAGTADAIGETADGVTLLDWKTSKGIYPEYSLQTVAYKYAAEEMTHEQIPNVVICRFGKDGSFGSYTVPKLKHPDLFDRFIDAKRLWDWQKQEAV